MTEIDVSSDFDQTIQTLQRVAKAFPEYRKINVEKRKMFLENFLFSIVQKKTQLILDLQKAQNGPFETAELEYVEALDYLHFFRTKFNGDLSKRLPLGPVVVYGSWSSPLLRFCEKVITALTLGNTVILHCEKSSVDFYKQLSEVVFSSRFPQDSLSIATPDDSSVLEMLYSHPAIRGVNFAGHTYEGAFLKTMPADHRKKYKVHLGGRNPVIFLYDADLENLQEILKTSLQFHYVGEMRFNRWFVQEKIFAPFTEKIEELLTAGEDLFPNDTYKAKWQRQLDHLKREKNWRTKDLTNYSLDFSNCSPIHQEEVIGPAITITRFKNSAEAIKFANTTFYANAAAVFTAEPDKAKDIANQLTMPLVTTNRIPQRFWEKPLYSSYESGWGCDVLDMDFFALAKISTVY